jgi:hypothetical protein
MVEDIERRLNADALKVAYPSRDAELDGPGFGSKRERTRQTEIGYTGGTASTSLNHRASPEPVVRVVVNAG